MHAELVDLVERIRERVRQCSTPIVSKKSRVPGHAIKGIKNGVRSVDVAHLLMLAIHFDKLDNGKA